MPGIVGYVGSEPDGISGRFLGRMARALESEDRFKYDLYHSELVGLGRVTLGIIEKEAQPVWNEDETLCLVMEGEIFNDGDIKQKLAQKGHRFRTNTDAELLLRLYEQEGENFPVELNGAFVVAIWDLRAKKLLLATDRFCLHPLYYAQVNGRLIFASGVRALLADPLLPRNTDCLAIAEFLTFDHVLHDRTFLEAVRFLPPASVLVYDDSHIQIHRYWKLRYADPYPVRSKEDLIEEFLYLLEQAVARMARHGSFQSGILLSGGLDSRFIAAYLCRELWPQKVRSFTWGIPGCDDHRYAKQVAAWTQATHKFNELKPDWLLEKAEEAVRITDGMCNLVNSHALATLEDEARHVQVLYKGFMGDALLGFGQRRSLWTSSDEATAVRAGFQVFDELGLFTIKPDQHESLFTESIYKKVGSSVFDGFISGLRNSEYLPDERSDKLFLP